MTSLISKDVEFIKDKVVRIENHLFELNGSVKKHSEKIIILETKRNVESKVYKYVIPLLSSTATGLAVYILTI